MTASQDNFFNKANNFGVNLIPRVLSYLLYGVRERERDPGKRWSRVSYNLRDYKQTVSGRGR